MALFPFSMRIRKYKKADCSTRHSQSNWSTHPTCLYSSSLGETTTIHCAFRMSARQSPSRKALNNYLYFSLTDEFVLSILRKRALYSTFLPFAQLPNLPDVRDEFFVAFEDTIFVLNADNAIVACGCEHSKDLCPIYIAQLLRKRSSLGLRHTF